MRKAETIIQFIGFTAACALIYIVLYFPFMIYVQDIDGDTLMVWINVEVVLALIVFSCIIASVVLGILKDRKKREKK